MLFVIAAGAAVVYGRVQAGDDARAAAQADARFAARLAAREIGKGIEVLQQHGRRARRSNPGVATAFAKPEDCGLSFGGTDAYTTGHLDLVRTDGSVACSSIKAARGGAATAGAEWLERALREPLLLAPAADPRTGEQVVLATAPVPKLGFVLASFNLDAVGLSLRDSYGGPRGLEFLLADASGDTILTRSIRAGALDRQAARRHAVRRRPRRRRQGPAVRERDRPRGRLAGPRRRRSRRRRSPPRASSTAARLTIIARRPAAVPARPPRSCTGAWRGRSRGWERRCAAPPPRAPRGWSPCPARPRSPRSPAGSTSSRWRSGASRRPTGSSSTAARCRCGCTTASTRRILEANDATVATYGYSREELLGVKVEDLERGPGEHVRKDGTAMEVSVASHAIDFRGREACVVIAEDVTEKERLRVQLQQSQRLESLGQLAGGVAHDFNNLLAVILGYASFIERRAEEGSQNERDVVEIRKAGERATRLTQQLLSFARREVVRPKVLDLTGVVIEMEQLLRRTLGEHVVLQHLAGAGPVADHGRPRAARAGPGQPRGQRPRRDARRRHADARHREHRGRRGLRERAGPGCSPGHYVRLRVSDTGVGMDREVAARAFEPFFTTKPKGQGTGLGLATIHGIVTQAGGHVQIYSEPGLGTTFTVLLPDDRRARPGARASTRAASPSRAAARRSWSSRTSRRCSR